MFHAFALQGPGDCGKTAALLKLYDKLTSKYPTATIKHIHTNENDISVVMHGVNGHVVGIESRGEPGSRLINSLNVFVAAKCDIIFCSCRTKGMTVKWVKTLPLQYKVSFIEKERVKTRYGTANASVATSLMKQAGI
jgi:hypothetical protein